MRGVYWLYVIGPQSGWPVKVGYTKNMMARASSLQSACWEQLVLHKRYGVVSKSQAIKFERLAHKRLNEHRMIGEWFNVFADDAIKVLDEIAKYQKYLEPSLKVIENLAENISA